MLTVWFMVNTCFCSPEALGHVVSVWLLIQENLVDNCPSLCQLDGQLWDTFYIVPHIVPRGSELESPTNKTHLLTHALLCSPFPSRSYCPSLSFQLLRITLQISHLILCSWFLSQALISEEPKLEESLKRHDSKVSSMLLTGMQT